jgi:serine/threonine protein kinase
LGKINKHFQIIPKQNFSNIMNNFTEGDVFHDRYKLLSYLGGGELSEVWKVHDQLADINVALKIYVRVGEIGIRQFIKDFTLTESLNHPFILKPNHVDVFDRRPYLILKYCSKGSVSNRIDESGAEYKPFSEKDIATFMVQIGGALWYLHQNQILHRDVKPDNIVLGDNGEFLLTDFGISKKVRTTFAKATSSTQVVSFSRPYAPPEILTGSEEPRKDIFSLGVTMYELLTEELPFDGNGGTVLLMGGIIPDLPAKYSPELNNIIKQCMNKEVDKRPTSKDLENYGNIFIKTGKWPNTIVSDLPKPVLLSEKKYIIPVQTKVNEFGVKVSKKLTEIALYSKKNTLAIIASTQKKIIELISEFKIIYPKYKIQILGTGGVLLISVAVISIFTGKSSKEVEMVSKKPQANSIEPPKTLPPGSEEIIPSTEQDKKYDSLMKSALLSFDKKDFNSTMQLTAEAWKTKNNDDAKRLYEKAQIALKDVETNTSSEDNALLERANTEMARGSLISALTLYKSAYSKNPSKECQTKIEICVSKMNTKCLDLIQQGKGNVDNNKSLAIDLFQEARELAKFGKLNISQIKELNQYYAKRADRLFDNEEYQDAKQWYQIAQSLQNTNEIQYKIQQCK